MHNGERSRIAFAKVIWTPQTNRHDRTTATDILHYGLPIKTPRFIAAREREEYPSGAPLDGYEEDGNPPALGAGNTAFDSPVPDWYEPEDHWLSKSELVKSDGRFVWRDFSHRTCSYLILPEPEVRLVIFLQKRDYGFESHNGPKLEKATPIDANMLRLLFQKVARGGILAGTTLMHRCGMHNHPAKSRRGYGPAECKNRTGTRHHGDEISFGLKGAFPLAGRDIS